MSDIVLRVEELYKEYRLGVIGATTLRDDIAHAWNRFTAKEDVGSYINNGLIWALQNINFEVKRGDVVGIIGKNGAGKSTLLKILSKVTAPTRGQIKIKGRIASLLEVGTGFHPELTGKENIFLNGAILGMTKAEVKRKLEEIIDFSGVEKYIDTPVKRYSSGMYVRLAFAVAAHLEPEILIVDEVLAVGDAEFQKKCLGKMKDVSSQGRTVLFVSHNMSAVLSLCGKAILLDSGKCTGYDSTESIVGKYLKSGKTSNGELYSHKMPRKGQKLKIISLKITDQSGTPSSEFDLRNEIFLQIDYEILIEGKGYNLAFELISATYGNIFTSSLIDSEPEKFLNKHYKTGAYRTTIKLPTHFMRGGEYIIKVASAVPTVEVLDVFEEELCFNLVDTNSPVAITTEGRSGGILPILIWETQSAK
jgi:lipopolysaccharide transport system ATP-binding protein